MWRKGSGIIPMCEEKGVYNFYLKVGGGKGKIEAVQESINANHINEPNYVLVAFDLRLKQLDK